MSVSESKDGAANLKVKLQYKFAGEAVYLWAHDNKFHYDENISTAVHFCCLPVR